MKFLFIWFIHIDFYQDQDLDPDPDQDIYLDPDPDLDPDLDPDPNQSIDPDLDLWLYFCFFDLYILIYIVLAPIKRL